MKTINISVVNKVALSPADVLVCGNNDWQIKFKFDDPAWNVPDHKTCRFIYGDTIIDKTFTGNIVDGIPVQKSLVLEVGVYAGNLITTTPAMIDCKKSILCKEGSTVIPVPSADVYTELNNKINAKQDKDFVVEYSITNTSTMAGTVNKTLDEILEAISAGKKIELRASRNNALRHIFGNVSYYDTQYEYVIWEETVYNPIQQNGIYHWRITINKDGDTDVVTTSWDRLKLYNE